MSAGTTRVDIEGELTILTAAEHHERLQSSLESRLEVGLAGVTDFDTAGLQVLLFAAREAARRGVAFHLTGHSAAVQDVLDLVRLTPDLEGVS